jgi:hypothetical protein
MTRFLNLLFLGFVLSLVGWSCGSGGGDEKKPEPDVSTLAPADNQVSGWVGDTTDAKTFGVTKIAHTFDEATALIDGSADPFYSTVTAKALAYQVYVNSAMPGLKIDLKVWQLASPADCQTVYNALASNPTYVGQPWEPIALGDGARIAAKGGTVRVNICKGSYLIEAALMGDMTDVGRNTLVAFVNVILAKIP